MSETTLQCGYFIIKNRFNGDFGNLGLHWSWKMLII